MATIRVQAKGSGRIVGLGVTPPDVLAISACTARLVPTHKPLCRPPLDQLAQIMRRSVNGADKTPAVSFRSGLLGHLIREVVMELEVVFQEASLLRAVRQRLKPVRRR